jgi:hypothetical protein
MQIMLPVHQLLPISVWTLGNAQVAKQVNEIDANWTL